MYKNKQYVYWQGLDSLTAPFLYLNFNDEGMFVKKVKDLEVCTINFYFKLQLRHLRVCRRSYPNTSTNFS